MQGFFCVCCKVSVLAKSLPFHLSIFFILCPLQNGGHQSSSWGLKAHSDDITRRPESRMMTVQAWILMELNFLKPKKQKKQTKAKQSKIMMSSFIEDKCFICFHTDLFLLLSSQCLHSIFSTLYILSCSLSLHPPQILKQKTSGWLPVCEKCKCFFFLSLQSSTTETSPPPKKIII